VHSDIDLHSLIFKVERSVAGRYPLQELSWQAVNGNQDIFSGDKSSRGKSGQERAPSCGKRRWE